MPWPGLGGAEAWGGRRRPLAQPSPSCPCSPSWGAVLSSHHIARPPTHRAHAVDPALSPGTPWFTCGYCSSRPPSFLQDGCPLPLGLSPALIFCGEDPRQPTRLLRAPSRGMHPLGRARLGFAGWPSPSRIQGAPAFPWGSLDPAPTSLPQGGLQGSSD